MLLSPLSGVERQDRILVVRGMTANRVGLSLSYPNFQDLRAAKPDGVADLVAFRLLPMNLRTGGEPVRVFGELVSAELLRLPRRPAGARPRLPRRRRLVPDRDAVAVISHDLWQRVFAGDPAAVGRAVTLNGRSFTIVGIAPPGFRGSVAAVALDVFVPVTMQKAVMAGDRLPPRAGGWLDVYARLADGAPRGRRRRPSKSRARAWRSSIPEPTAAASFARCRCGGPARAACCCRCSAR